MTNDEILKQINAIFIDILDNEEIVLTSETSANDVDDWDSLNHIQLVVAIERHFKVRFTAREIQSWCTVGEMVNAVSSKLN